MEQYMFAHHKNLTQPKGDSHLWLIAVKKFKNYFNFFVVYFDFVVIGQSYSVI